MSDFQEETAISALCDLRRTHGHTGVLSQDTMKVIRNTLEELRYKLGLHEVKDVEAFFGRMHEEIQNSGNEALVQQVNMMHRLVTNGELTGDTYMAMMIMLLGIEYFRTNFHRPM